MSRALGNPRRYDSDLRSDTEGIEWPAIPGPSAALMLSLLDQMQESQWWDAEKLRAQQMRQLRALVHQATTQVPFYGGSGNSETVSHTIDGVDLQGWKHLPVLTREEVQDNYEALQSRHVPESHGPVTTVDSSGSTGRPVSVRTTRLAITFAGVCGLRAHRWHGRDIGAKLALIHIDRKNQAVYPDGLEQPGWGWPASEIYRTGPAVILSLRTPIFEQAEWLQRQDPDYLLSCPSNLQALAEYCIDEGLRFPGLRSVASIMEVVTPQMRNACQEAWGVPVVDMYTTKETGTIAVQCPEHEHYHVMAEDLCVEVIGDDGRTCAPGEVGRVVVTPLHNFATPLLRYEVGDYAEVGPPCPCGRGLPVLKRILGRVRNMLILPDGQRYWPSLPRRKLVETMPIKQHQLVQRDLGTVELRLVTDRPLTAGEEDEIRRLVSERLPAPFEVLLSRVEEIGRGPGGKFEDFYSEVAR